MRKLTKAQLRANARRAIDDAGGRAEVARHFAIRYWAVSKWYHKGRVPPGRVLPLCALANKARGDSYWTPVLLLEG